MTDWELARGAMGDLEAVTAFNAPVFQSHAEITAILRQRIGASAADMFARPVVVGQSLVWTTHLPGAGRCLAALSPGERDALEPRRRALADHVGGLVDTLQRSGPNTRLGNLAHLLEAALVVPGLEHMHLLGDQLVLTFWGFRRQGHPGLLPLGARIPAAGPAPAARRLLLAWLSLPCLVCALLLIPAGLHREPPPPTPPTMATEPPPPAGMTRPTLAPAVPPTLPAPARPPPAPAEKPVPATAPLKPAPRPKPRPKPVAEQDITLHMPVNGDLSRLRGCWRTDRYSYDNAPSQEVSTYCFDTNGHGTLVHEGGGTTCRAPADIEMRADGAMYLADRDSRCSDGSIWHQDRLLCTGTQGGVAQCEGQANLVGGNRVHWVTTLHRH